MKADLLHRCYTLKQWARSRLREGLRGTLRRRGVSCRGLDLAGYVVATFSSGLGCGKETPVVGSGSWDSSGLYAVLVPLTLHFAHFALKLICYTPSSLSTAFQFRGRMLTVHAAITSIKIIRVSSTPLTAFGALRGRGAHVLGRDG